MTDRKLFKLIKELGHKDASRRRLAAEQLAAGDERAVYPLIKALYDENPGVQDASIQSLIAVGGEVTAYMVTPLLRDGNPFIRNSAIVILRSLGSISIPFLYNLLKDKDDDVRKFSLDLLGEIRDNVLIDKIVPLLKDHNSNVRGSAVKALGMIGRKEALPFLTEALTDEEWVAFSAIEAIAQIGDESALDSLFSVLSSGAESLRIAAIEAIGEIGTPEAKDMLQRHLKKTRGIEKDVTVKSLLQLGTLPEDKDAADYILKLFVESDWEDKLLYLKGLTKLQHHEAIPAIIDIAGSLDPSMPDSEEVLQEVKERLKEFGCADSIIEVIKAPHFRFRGKVIAIDLIGERKCRRAVPFLIELVRSDLRDVRRASIRALEEIDGEGVKDLLIEFIDDHDGHVRRAAVIALGKIGATEAFEPIFQLLFKEPYMDVKEEAIKALFRIDRERFLSRKDEVGSLKEIIDRYSGD